MVHEASDVGLARLCRVDVIVLPDLDDIDAGMDAMFSGMDDEDELQRVFKDYKAEEAKANDSAARAKLNPQVKD